MCPRYGSHFVSKIMCYINSVFCPLVNVILSFVWRPEIINSLYRCARARSLQMIHVWLTAFSSTFDFFGYDVFFCSLSALSFHSSVDRTSNDQKKKSPNTSKTRITENQLRNTEPLRRSEAIKTYYIFNTFVLTVKLMFTV